MEFDLSNAGDQFGNDGARVMGNDEDYDMEALMLQFVNPNPASPTTRTVQRYLASPSLSTTQLSPYAQQNTNTPCSIPQRSYADVVRRGTQQSIHVTLPPSPPIPMIGNIQQQRHSQAVAGSDWTWHQINHNEHIPHNRQQTYAQALRSPPPAQPLPNNRRNVAAPLGSRGRYVSEHQVPNVDQLRPNAIWLNGSFQGSAQTFVDPQSLLPGVQPQVTENDMTKIFNWQPGITEPFASVRDWTRQPRATVDRTIPQLDTRLSNQRLAPTPQSPLSTSSRSSSRISVRRNKHQLTFGKYRCDICPAAFDTVTDLNHHIRSHTPYEQRPYRCGICAGRFMYAKDLRRHAVVHNPNAPKHLCHFPNCRHATIGFKREDHLERHLRTQHAVDSVQQSSHPSSQYES